MLRRQLKQIVWTVLLICVLLARNSQCSPVSKSTTKQATKAPAPKSSTSLIATTKPTARTTTTPSSTTRKATQTKTKRKRPTTTAKPSSTEAAIDKTSKTQYVSSTSPPKVKHNDKKTTTLSPIEVMNRLYQMHGLSHSSSAHSSSSSSSSSAHRKKHPPASQHHESSMDDIYRLHALAQTSSSHNNKPQETTKDNTQSQSSSSSTEKAKKKPSSSQYSNIDQVYQQHSSLPSSMHHIMSQHSSQPQRSRPQKASSPQKELSSSSLSTFMQPLLKQLTPVGAGIGAVLAPILLFNGFLQFFSNISKFLNNFAQTMHPVRKPPNPVQNQNYFQNPPGAHLRRQPRDWLLSDLQRFDNIEELAEQISRALQTAEK